MAKNSKPKKMVKVEYSSNNSGGSWWLKPADWTKLEKAGWQVQWGGDWFCNSKYPSLHGGKTPQKPPKTLCAEGKCEGHRLFEKMPPKDSWWLGAPATYASKRFESLADAVREWEEVTGQDATDEGCNCCGAPHSFSTRDGDKYESGSGEDLVAVLYGEDSPKTLREAVRRLRGGH